MAQSLTLERLAKHDMRRKKSGNKGAIKLSRMARSFNTSAINLSGGLLRLHCMHDALLLTSTALKNNPGQSCMKAGSEYNMQCGESGSYTLTHPYVQAKRILPSIPVPSVQCYSIFRRSKVTIYSIHNTTKSKSIHAHSLDSRLNFGFYIRSSEKFFSFGYKKRKGLESRLTCSLLRRWY